MSIFYGLCRSLHDIFAGNCPTFSRALPSIELFFGLYNVIAEASLPLGCLCVKLEMAAPGKLHHILCFLLPLQRERD